MIIDCIADLHGYKPQLGGGDLLIVAGDLTARDMPAQYDVFARWLDNQDYKEKIVIAGNHDGLLEKFPDRIKWDKPPSGGRLYSASHYLCDSVCKVEGLKIWGSPWTPTFLDWYFMKDRGDPIKEMWDKIPNDIDILITHGPPFGIQDQVDTAEKFLGCEELRNAILRIKPKLHVFGHIHEGFGHVQFGETLCVNCSYVDGRYNPVNHPIRIKYDRDCNFNVL